MESRRDWLSRDSDHAPALTLAQSRVVLSIGGSATWTGLRLDETESRWGL